MNSVKFMPLFGTLKGYKLDIARDDLTAALIVTIMLIPQSLAYAMLAGLPPEVGLYSSILPLILYALFGTSGSLAVGPVAIIALMTGTTILQVSIEYDYAAVEVAVALALLSGAMLILMGCLKLGFIVNFISRSVIEGFVTASAILIVVSQLKHIFAIDIQGHTLDHIVRSLLENSSDIHLPTFLLGTIIFTCLILVKPVINYIFSRLEITNKWQAFLPRVAPAILVVLSIMLMNFTSMGQMHIATVGYIPNGIPDIGIMEMNYALFEILLLPAALLSLIGYIESISVASRFAAKSGERIEPNNELLGLGAANIGSSLSGGMPVTGGFSRSVVNFNSGSKTPVAGIMSAFFIAILVSGMVGLLQELPKATLAAAIIAAVIGLVDINKLKETWYYSKQDFVLMMVTILTTLFFGVEIGISTGITLSICMHLYLTSKPHMAIIGLVPGTEHFRNVLRHEVQTLPEIIGIRIDESLYFANASYLEKEVINIVYKSELIEHCILQFSSVSNIDASALESLETINSQLQDMGIILHLSEVKGPVMDKFKKTQFARELKDRIHLSHYQAVQSLSKRYHAKNSGSDVYETNM